MTDSTLPSLPCFCYISTTSKVHALLRIGYIMAFVPDNQLHLRQGAEQPVFDDDKPILYSLRFSPYAERARLVLNYKQIPFNVVNVHIRQKPEWFLKKTPLGKVPTWEEKDGTIVYESLILAEYLDEKYPNRPLLPKDPFQRAAQKQMVEAIVQTVGYKHTILEGDSASKDLFLKGLDAVEKMLTSPFWAGNEVGFVDLMVWPFFERIPAIGRLTGLDISAAHYPNVFAWMERMLVVESRYKCPGCLIRYCSLPCFKQHKTDSCSGSATTTAAVAPAPFTGLSATAVPTFKGGPAVQDVSSHVKRLLKEIPEEERLQKNALEQLEKSDDLKNLLKDVSLQKMLTKSLDVRNRREALDNLQLLISHEPQFAAFATTCLNIVAPSSPGAKP
ncbi:putative Glutathione S-transferase omega-1 [Hypsibius exemplaris]|uniref:Glutathione S-transferase omega-1 n=1 Tax=Hypsibius exemplaris TaxID=2072580 RepID=A0A9X6RK23_HYPEX|nr:putative Glutathione S-transferase omega-1 [Hypsibius exemplaris]